MKIVSLNSSQTFKGASRVHGERLRNLRIRQRSRSWAASRLRLAPIRSDCITRLPFFPLIWFDMLTMSGKPTSPFKAL